MTDHRHPADVPHQGEDRLAPLRAQPEGRGRTGHPDAQRRRDHRQGGGEKAIESQHKKGRLTARERIALLIDPGTEFFELGAYVAWGMYEEWGGAPAAGVVTGLGARAGPTGDAHRQRRHGEGRRVLSHDGEEGHPRAEHRHREPHPHHLPGRFRRRVSAAAGRCLPRHRRFRPRLPQQCRDVGDGHSADRRHHGHVRGRRRVSAADVRPHPDDRRQRTVSRRAGAGAGRHRREVFRRRTGRRQDALADQRHGGLPRARRRILHRAHSPAGRQDGQPPARRLRPQASARSRATRPRKSTASSTAIPRASTT